MRDKGSWIAKAHYSLRRSHPSIRMCLSVLGGDWTKGSKEMLQSTGETIIEIPMSHVVSVFEKEGVHLKWEETDRDTPKKSWEEFKGLTAGQKQKVGKDLLSIHKDLIVKTIKSALSQNMSISKIKKIEFAIELENGRTIVHRFPNEPEFAKFMETFDPENLG